MLGLLRCYSAQVQAGPGLRQTSDLQAREVMESASLGACTHCVRESGEHETRVESSRQGRHALSRRKGYFPIQAGF